MAYEKKICRHHADNNNHSPKDIIFSILDYTLLALFHDASYKLNFF